MGKWGNGEMVKKLRERVIMDKQGRIVIPLKMRRAFNVKEASVFEVETFGKDRILLTVLAR